MKREWSSGDEDDPGEYEIAVNNEVADIESNITFRDLMLELVKGKKFHAVICGLDSEPAQIIVEELNNILDDENAFDRFRNETARNSEGFSNWYNSLADEEKLKIELDD